MKKFFKGDQLIIALSSIIASIFLVVLVVSGATTIGTNIQTDGTASSTSATTTDYLYVGTDITELDGWDFTGGDLIVSGAAHFAAKATSTTSFAVGAGTINNLDMAGGDLYVQGDAEVDGRFAFGTSTTPVSVLTFGTCSVAFAGSSVAANATTTADCTATGTNVGDKVFMTPTGLEKWLVFNSASTTADNTIQVQVFNASSSAAITTVSNTWYWLAIH